MNQLRKDGLGYALDNREHLVRFSIDNLRPMGTYLGGWVTVESIEGDAPTFLHQGTYRIDDPNDENKLVKELFTLSPETREMGQWVWKEQVRLFFAAVVHHERDGVAWTRIGRLDMVDDNVDVIQDLIQTGDPTILYGRGAATKGIIATALAVHIALGRDFITLRTTQGVPMYLDWEDNATRLNQRVQGICRGLGLTNKADFPEIPYLRCSQPLSMMVNKVCRERDRTGATFLVVDSMDPASGYSENWNERAGRLFDALRVIDMTTLIIAHTNKASIAGHGDQKQDANVFGSIMNTNRARSVWRVEKEQEPESPEATVTLHHDKTNSGKIKKPLSLTVSWRHAGQIRLTGHIPWDKVQSLSL